jgi:hypothetical protein
VRAALLILLIGIFVLGWIGLVVLWFIILRAYRKWLGSLIARGDVPSWLLGLVPPFRGFWRVPPAAIISFQPMSIVLRHLARSDPDAETELERRRVVRNIVVWLAIFVGAWITLGALLIIGT